ncbi:MAG: radical SAM protein [Patescibacteria group bacterium]
MKLLLLFPNTANWATISTAIPILSGIAKNRGWNVEYFDTYSYEKGVDSSSDKEETGGFKPGFSLFKKITKPFFQIATDLQKKIDEFQPDLIAITALSQEYELLMKFFPEIKVPSKTKVIIGGIHVMLTRDEVIETKMFDIVAFGEAEGIFDWVLERIEKHGSLKGFDGIYLYDKKTGEIIKHSKRKLLPPDELWKVERDFSFFNDAYFIRPFDGKQIRRYDMETARGCPYNCAYCGNSALKEFNKGLGKYVKIRPINSSIKHMKKMNEQYKIDIFQFSDECFFSHQTSWLVEFMDKYKAEINKPYIFQTRAETISEEKIDLLLGYGMPFQVSIGVESGSDYILNDLCDRICARSQILKAFEIMNKRKIRTNAFFMIGFPFEKREDAFSTIELCRAIKPSVASVAIFQPLPGQKITKQCIEKGFITGKEPMATFTSHSLLNMPKPYLSGQEIHDLWRTFMLYSSLPKEYYDDIEKCEKDIKNNQELFNKLIKLRWEKYDLAKEKGDIRLV